MAASDPFADHLLACAKFFRASIPSEARPVPDTFENEEEAFGTLKAILLVDAHHSLQDVIEPPAGSMVYHGIDLDGQEPGVTVRGDEIRRGDATIRPIAYERVARVAESAAPRLTEKPPLTASRVDRLAASAQKRAEKATQKAERDAEYAFMSAAEKKAERERRKEEAHAAKRARREAAGEPAPAEPAEPTEPAAPKEPAESAEPAPPDETAPAAADETAPAAAEETAPAAAEGAAPAFCGGDAVDAVVRSADSVRPARRKPGVRFFESPAAHDRHLSALTHVGLHPDVRDSVLRGVASAAVVVLDGPPGCGKTTALLDRLEQWLATHPGERAFVCAPTNLGAADLFTRSIKRRIGGALALAKEHMPADVPRMRGTDLACERVVFATVSGRSAPRLVHQHDFAAVFLDEAAHTSEAHTFGLLRPSVATLVMAGDVQQLPAQTTPEAEALLGARSMMERLLSVGMPCIRLTVQHRMHPEILRFVNETFYAARLSTAADRETRAGVDRPYRIVDVPSSREAAVGTSVENPAEAAVALAEARRLQAQGLAPVLLAPYQAQARRLLAAKSGIAVATVDGFQGKEADSVVLTVTRSASAGFWEDARRLTVALTRARHAMVVVMNVEAWRATPGPLGDMARDALARELVASA